MNRNSSNDEHIDGKARQARADILEGDKVVQSLLPELEAVQEVLNMLDRQIDDQHSNINKRLCEMGCSKISAVIESMAEGVVMINRSGIVEIANPVAKLLLGLAAESCASDARTAMENIGLKHLFDARQQALSKAASEFVCKSPAGKILQIKWNAIIGSEGRFGGYVIVMRDTTAQVELEKTQTEFIAAISHELRTPLTTLQNSISNMLAGVTGKTTDKTNQYLNAMQNDCHRLARLINDLLDMAKLEAGKMYLSRSATNLVEVAGKVVRGFSDNAAEKKVSIEVNTTGCISRVYVDAQRLYQVFSNLVTNAIKYTDKGGSIWISLFERGDEVVTVVEDTGIGIAPDRQKNVFNKFYQISRQAGPGYNGSGLGLAISSEIVSAHGGKMWLESEFGKGSKFYFSLPKMDPKVVLHKHLASLVERGAKNGERFTVMAVRLDVSGGNAVRHKQAIETAMKKMMLAGEEAVMAGSDLIVRSGDCEAVVVLGQTGKRYLKHVKTQLRNAIYDALAELNCNDGVILPMIGTALYPNDASTVEALKMKAMTELNRLD